MITKEQVLAEAKRLGLTLTDAEVDQYVKDNKLPEKKQSPEERKEELRQKYSTEQIIEMVLEARSEAKDRRLENKTLKEQMEAIKTDLQGSQEFKTKYPELEKKLNQFSESEKKRREVAMAKLEEGKRATVSYLLDVNTIGADQFDSTIALLTETKSPGSGAPGPGAEPPKGQNPFDEDKPNYGEQIRLQKSDPVLAKKLQDSRKKK